MRKSAFLINIVLIILSVPIVGMAGNDLGKLVGLRSVPVPVVGTGSMYPSLFWSTTEGGPEDEANTVIEEYRSTPHLYRRFDGITIGSRNFLRRPINYGDMVAFKNDKTASILKSEDKDIEQGFIKRVIAVGGDTIELRDGFVYKNRELLDEPYISAPRTTYGGTGIKDCQVVTVPENQFFVMGDNRKVSSDSRFELGLIKERDIQFILPLSEQKIYLSLWRDTTKDDDLLGAPTLVAEDLLALVNNLRKGKGLSPLKLDARLVRSSSLRGAKLLADSNTTFGMKQAIAASGYSNIILGEFVSHGRFSAKELLENLLYQAGTTKQILSKDFTELGVSAVTADVNGCPTQVIVGHLGGYLPATYSDATVASWRNLRTNLDEAISSWQPHKDENAKVADLLTILSRRLNLAQEIITAMEKKSWLTPSQEQRIKTDEADAQSAEKLAKELNNEWCDIIWIWNTSE